MTQSQCTDSVLRRKAGRSRHGNSAASDIQEAGDAALPRLLRRAVARAGQNEIGLRITVGALREYSEISLAELLDLPEAGALLAVLEGPAEDLGLMALAPALVEGAVQHQTTGHVFPGNGNPRRPTRTDAAMTAGLIDRIMREFERLLARGQDLGWAGGYRYASFLDDPRTLGLLLEDVGFRAIALDLTLGDNLRHGAMLLALPRQRQGVAARGRPGGPPGAESASARTEHWQAAMEQAVMTSHCDLRAVLVRLSLPLAAIMRWQPGDVVGLPMARLDRVTLCSAGGHQLALGRLGQSRGFRALRLGELSGASCALPHGDQTAAEVGRAAPCSGPAAGAPTASAPEMSPDIGNPDPAPVPAASPGPVPLPPVPAGDALQEGSTFPLSTGAPVDLPAAGDDAPAPLPAPIRFPDK